MGYPVCTGGAEALPACRDNEVIKNKVLHGEAGRWKRCYGEFHQCLSYACDEPTYD